MNIVIKILLLSLFCFGVYQDLQAQNKKSKSSNDLDSAEIVKIKEFFSDVDINHVTMLKIKQLIPDLDTVKMNKIRIIIPYIQYYDDSALERTKEMFEPDTPNSHRIGLTYGPQRDTIIVKGSEVHWRFNFDKRITYVELQGIGRASRKDIQAGKWHITTKPKRTTTYYIDFIRNGEKWVNNKVKVIVVESESEAKKVKDELEKKREAERKSNKRYTRSKNSRR